MNIYKKTQHKRRETKNNAKSKQQQLPKATIIAQQIHISTMYI